MEELFPNVFTQKGNIFTKNLIPGTKVYGEKLVTEEGIEYKFEKYSL